MEDDYRDCQFEYEKPVAPTSLKVVAWLFIISGVLSVIDIIGSLFNDHLKVDLGVLGIFVGLGLLLVWDC